MKDKVVIITGASSGIGLACVNEFAERGAKIVLAARSIDKLDSIERDLNNKGIETLTVKTDVSKEEDCKKMIEATIDRFGKIDVLINNAGISMRALFADLDLSVIKDLMDTNFWGTVYCTKYALPYLLESKGSVTAISSISGYVPLPGRTGYCSSKYAIHGFLETLRIENFKNGLHVLIAAPGFTASDIRKKALTADGSMQGETPRKEEKMMSAEETAVHIANAIEKRKRSLILTAEGKIVVLLKKLLPKLSDRLTYNHMAKEPNAPIAKA